MTDDLDLLPSREPVQLIDPVGRPTGLEGCALPDDESLVEAHQALVAARRLNDQAYAWVRQGRLAVYPSSHGQEACQVAAALALGADAVQIGTAYMLCPEATTGAVHRTLLASAAGARLGRLSHWEALAVGFGMNARGAMGLIVAMIGLSLGLLTAEMFSIIVLMAMVTSLVAPSAVARAYFGSMTRRPCRNCSASACACSSGASGSNSPATSSTAPGTRRQPQLVSLLTRLALTCL